MELTARLVHDLDQYRAWLRETIRAYGWAVEAVSPDGPEPGFAHTVGLTGFHHPELIVFSAPTGVAGHLLNSLGELVRCGGTLRPGQTVVPPGCPAVTLLDFPGSDQWLPAVDELYRLPGGPPVPALLVLPADAAPDDDPADGWPEPDCPFCR